jgi:hypothetical protein
VNSAHIQVVKAWFGFKGEEAQIRPVADEFLPAGKPWRPPMQSHYFYLSFLEDGPPLAVKAASVAVSAVLFLIVALPVLAVGAAVVA